MPRYEIVAHVTSEMDCQTAEEAAAIIRRQIMDGPAGPNQLLHLAVWQEALGATPSPVDPVIRARLVDFFMTLERSAAEAEEAFRGQVEAILMGTLAPRDDATAGSAARAGGAQHHEPEKENHEPE